MSKVVGFDYETELMAGQRLAPPVVCLSAVTDDAASLYGRVEKDELEALQDTLFDSSNLDYIRVAHNASFDLAVTVADRPELITSVFDLLKEDRLHCTIIREKLLNLVQYGHIDFIEMPDGSNYKVSYSLSSLMSFHFGIDISPDKKGDDAWRTNYVELADVPVEEYPQAARDYAVNDSKYSVMLWGLQEDRREEIKAKLGVDPFETLNFRCMADFSLYLMSCWGVRVDACEKAKIEAMLAEKLKPENLEHLLSEGILRPGVPPRPYKNKALNEDGTPKMTAAKKESINKKALQEIVKRLCDNHGIEVEMTSPSDTYPEGTVSTKADFIDRIAHLHPALEEYKMRQKLQKLVTTELPRMEWNGQTAPVIHPMYDVLKETGRTSSYASKMFPSFNCQNVDPRVRNCIVPRPGHYLFSIDYSQMELGTLAQRCIDLFGYSIMADKINKGYDLHAYLGSQIAKATDDEFGKKAPEDDDECYLKFLKLKSSEDEEDKKFFKHYRTLAKPTGLGYPGGLGAETMTTYAKGGYGVSLTIEEAENLREVWLDTFKEMRDYFRYINKDCIDPVFSSPADGDFYCYTTPFGLYRPNCVYCAAANGVGLQSPSAEGAILSVINVVRASLDPALDSILYGNIRPILFIHDEIVGEVRISEYTTPSVREAARIMVESMRVVTPDVEPKAEPALMLRWDKSAEPVFDDSGSLIPWTPSN